MAATNTRVAIPKGSMNPLLRSLNDLLESKITELMNASIADNDGTHTFSEVQIREMIPTAAEFGLLMKPERASKAKKAKDPNRPKKPKTAYLLFTHSDETRLAFKEANPDKWDLEKSRPNKITDLTKWASVKWKALTEDQQAPYKATQNELSTEYQGKMAEYQPSQFVHDEEDVPEAPQGWSGPFNGFYLWKNVEGKKTYKTFQEAISVAEANNEALGVTKTPSGVYSVRRGEGGQPYPSAKGETSWMKGEATVTVVTPSSTKKNNNTNTKTPKEQHTIDPQTNHGEDDAFDPEAEVDQETNNGYIDVDPTAQNSDDEDSDEDDDAEADVERWTYQEVEYLVNTDNGHVYDAVKYDTLGEIIKLGIREPNTNQGEFKTD